MRWSDVLYSYHMLDIDCGMKCIVHIICWISTVVWSIMLCLHHMLDNKCGIEWYILYLYHTGYQLQDGDMCCVWITCWTSSVVEVICFVCTCVKHWLWYEVVSCLYYKLDVNLGRSDVLCLYHNLDKCSMKWNVSIINLTSTVEWSDVFV
jgi:hypothetical protein